MIKRFVKFQAELLSQRSLLQGHTSDESILIALSLRCLVLTHEIFLVDGYVPFNAFESTETDFRSSKCFAKDPSIEVSRLSCALQDVSSAPKHEHEESISSMLEGLLQTIQHLMFRRKPQEWPLLLCTLCLLKMISTNLSPIAPWMLSLEPSSQAMNSVFSTLCHLFDTCSKTLHPLSDNWDKEKYAELVENDNLLVEFSQWMNDEWVEGTSPLT